MSTAPRARKSARILVRLLRNAAEMIGRAAERDRQAEAIERRQQALELRRVLEGELARERYYGANASGRFRSRSHFPNEWKR